MAPVRRVNGIYILVVLCTLAIVFSACKAETRRGTSIYTKEENGPVDAIRVEELRKEIETYIQRHAALGDFPSFAIGIVIGDQLAYRYCYNTDMSATYYIASITKIFTALSIMQLVENGEIDLDASINDYFPGVSITREEFHSPEVTIRQLLSHSSGLPDIRYYCPPFFSKTDGIDLKIPGQIYPPGRHYRYANHGFMLLGLLVEKIRGKSYSEYLKRNVFEPIGMKDAKTHNKLTGAGGIAVSLQDMSRFASMWLREGRSVTGERVIQSATIKKMLEQQLYIPYAKRKSYVGLGWRVYSDESGVMTFFHIGGATGVSAWLQVFPRYNCAVIYLGDPNAYSPKLMGYLTGMQHKLAALASAMVGARQPLDAINPTLPTPEIMKKYVGTYWSPLNKEIAAVFLYNGDLCLTDSRESIQLSPYTSHIFQGGNEMVYYDFVYKLGKDEPDGLATYYGYFQRIDEKDQEKLSVTEGRK